MYRRTRRVVQEAKRDPAGMKFRLDLHFMRHRGMFCAKLVRGRRIVLIEQLAGEKPAFGPPFVAVDDKRGVARCGDQDICRRADLVGMAQLVDLRVKVAGVGPKGRGHIGEKLVARCFVDDSSAGLGERQHIGTSQGGGTECRGGLILVGRRSARNFWSALSR